MEQKAKFTKKLLSTFLALLMIFSACYAGVNGVYTVYAAQGDSKYTHAEVIESINAALADGKSYSSSGNAFTVSGDNGKTLAAAERIFDYAVKTYRTGRATNAQANSGDTLLAAFLAEFQSQFSDKPRGTQLATAVLNPAGTTVYGYENKQKKSGTYSGQSDSWGSKGTDVTDKVSSYPTNVADSATKTVSIKVDVDAFLQTFEIIDEIPSSFLTEVSYTYAHTSDKQALLTKDSESYTEGSGCNAKTYYKGSYDAYKWNYMSAKPVRTVAKNTTAKKYLKSVLKFFNEEVLAYSEEDLLAMPLSSLEYLDKQALDFEKMMNENFSDATLAHFDVPKSEITAFITRLAKAHKVVAAKSAIDTMDALVGSEYNVESYSEMSSLYNKVNSAYGVVTSMEDDILTFIRDHYDDVEAKYDSINFTEAKAYIDTLFEIMTEQRLEEMVNSMMAQYDQYNTLLVRENVNEPTDPEVSSLLSQKNSWNSLLGTYTSKDYYRTYYTAEIEAKWVEFAAKIDAVAEVRGLKADYQTYYDYFFPIIYTAELNNKEKYDNSFLMTLYDEMDTQLENLSDKYDDIKTNYNETIAKNIFTLNYEGENKLLQDIITASSSTGKAEIQKILVARTEQQIDNVQVYKDVTTVNFDNFAVIKSTISHFDYELYDYVNGKNWLSADYKTKYGMVQTLLDRYHAFSTTDGKQFFDEDYTFVEDGYYAIRYAGDRTVDTGEVDENGDAIVEQLGYSNDIARGGAGDDFYVDEAIMLQTIAKVDDFIVSRDFGTLLGFYDEETEEYLTLGENIDKMLTEMLYNDEMVNTLVGAIFPMLCDLLVNQLIGALGTMDGAWVDENGVPWLDLNTLASIDADLALYLDTQYAPSHDGGNQKEFPQVFKELGLYVFPNTLAESLAISNPSFYGKDSEIYKALSAAGRDWSNLIVEDDPDTLDVDETKALEFAWGVYDEDSFLDTVACVLDAIVPLLQALFSTKDFKEEVSNVAIGYSPSLLGVENVFIRGGLRLSIPHLGAYSTLIVPLFEVLGVTDIPKLSSDCSGDDISRGVFGTLLNRIDEILADPLANILEILPNLVYFLSMDSVQEMLDSLVININLNIHEVEVIDFDGWLGYLLDGLDGLLAEKISFDVPLDIADLIEGEGGLYGLLGFELTNFNEVLQFALTTLLLDEETGEPLLPADALPEIRQQEIIFCSDWVGAAGDKSPLESNKGDLLYWFLNYIITALQDENFMNTILGMLSLGDDEETGAIITALIQRITTTFAGNPRGALAAIVELLNPVDYTHNLKEMDWVESQWNYDEIAGVNAVDMVYLSYSNDWTEDKANYLVDNIDSIVTSVLEMVEMDLEGAADLGEYLQNMIGGLFTNETITTLVTMLAPLGATLDAVMEDIIANQIGIDIDSWFTAFGYLLPAETWEDVETDLDFTIVEPTDKSYVNNFGVEGVLNEDGTISWFFNRMPLVDGDGYTFVNILTRLLGPAEILIKFLFAGADISAFAGLLTLIGYETYESTFGMLLEALGVQNVPTQEAFNNDTMGSFSNMLISLLDWFYGLTNSDDMITQLLEIIPDVFYYVESNGLTVLLHNVLMPVIVLLDTFRPLMDINVNQLLSIIISEFINYETLDINVILQYLIYGIYQSPSMDLDYVYYSIDINNLRLSDLLLLVDAVLGTNLSASKLVYYGVTGLCSGIDDVETSAGVDFKRPTVTAADAITILLTAFIECLADPALDTTKTNGEVLFAYLAEMMENDQLAGMYDIIAGLLEGIEVTYTEPNWGYMLPAAGDDIFTVGNARETIEYLAYTTDWTEAKAEAVYNKLDDVLASLIPEEDFDFDVATLLNSMLEDNVYSDANLNMIVETIVNLFAGINSTLFDVIDVVIDTDIASWFVMCEEQTDAETGETKLVCTKDWGVDEAADKRATFIAALEEVLAPANALLAWALFGDDYDFFTGAAKDENGNYIYNDIINLNGGEGYERAIVPLLRALTLEPAPTSAYLDATTGKYDAAAAVSGILNTVFDLIDTLTDAESVIGAAMDLIPNIIYFLNADGIKSAVNNLLDPINGLLDIVGPLLGEEISIAALLGDLPIDITDITTESVLALLTEQFGVQFVAMDDEGNVTLDLGEILSTLYVGELAAYEYADNLTGYTLDVSAAEYDVLTLVLSFAIEMFTINGDLFAGMLGENGEEIVDGIIAILEGYTVTYTDPDWAYMYEGEDALATLAADGFPTATIKYLEYSTDWPEATAQGVYNSLDDILVLVMDSVADGNTIAQLIEGVLTDNVYTDANLVAIVELIVNAIAGLDASLLELIDIVLDTNIAAWFEMCDVDADGTYVVKENYFAVDAAADKKAAFVAGLKEVLAPANELLAWLFFGDTYTFFNGSDGEAIITLIGGEGYAQGLVPIFEALGCTMPAADTFKEGETYNVGNAVAAILDAALALVDTISANPIEEVFALIPNLLYFINANGLNSAVSNLLAPINGVLAELTAVTGAENLQALLADLIDFDLNDLGTDALFNILATEVGFITNVDMVAAVKNIYALGEADDFTSANGETAYRVDITDREYDVLTVVLSFALDAFNLNKALFSDLLGGEDKYMAVYNLLLGATMDYQDINWNYMETESTPDADGVVTTLPAHAEDSVYAIYTKYANNWNKETAEYVNEIIDTLVQSFFENNSLGQMLDNAIAKGLYTDDLLNDLIVMVVELIYEYGSIIESAGVLLGAEGLAGWWNGDNAICQVTTDANGEIVVTVTKDFGIDEAATNDEKREKFVNAFVEVLEPTYRVLAWLLFAEDFEFFNGYTNDPLITLTGGKGYEMALVPLLEAVGAALRVNGEIVMPGTAAYSYLNGVSGLKAAAEYYVDGELDMAAFVKDLFGMVTDWLYVICGDLKNPGEIGVISTMLEMLPNVVYNINAGTLDAVINNLLLPVNELIGHLGAFGVKLDIEALLADLGFGYDAEGNALFNWYGIFNLVEELVRLYWPDFDQEFLATLYFGQLVPYTSANGSQAYYMTFVDDGVENTGKGTRADLITLVISFVADAVADKRNEPRLVGWFGQEVYDIVYAYISGNTKSVDMQKFDWILTEYAGTGKVLSPVTQGSIYDTVYGKYFTQEMGMYMEENLPEFIDTTIELLGIEIGEGEDVYESLEDILDSLVGDTIYTKANVEMIVNALADLIASVEESLDATLYDLIVNVLNTALGIDVTYWNDYQVSNFEDGDRTMFVNELIRALKPVHPLLAWLLTDEDLIALFHSADGSGRDMVVIEGAEGYAYGIIPLMEALACENIRTPDEFKLAANAQPENMLRLIIDPILDKVDIILADPVNEIFEILPGVIYFLNSNGLDTVIKNTANAIFTVLENIEPALVEEGEELDVYELIGFNPKELNIDTLIDELLTDLEADTGLEFKDAAVLAINELTVGEVVEFTSKNGLTAYTMKYASEEDRADMVTVLLRFALTFVTVEENARALKVMLKDELSEDGYKFVCALLDNFVDMAKTADGMDKILYTIYYIFIGAEGLVEGVDGSLDEANDNYGFMQDLFENSDVPFMKDIAGTLGDFMDKNFNDIVDSEGIVPNGFIKFFQSLASIFEKIINWFKGFFN